MHPAPSVIVFTTLSGLGFGLLFWLGLGLPTVTGWGAFFYFALAYALSVGGLLASTFHLGHPERAWRAFSQWRSSWLSREGVCAVAALIVLAVYGAGLVFFGARWGALGVIGSLLALGTVFTTAMIYTQLKTVPRWNTPLTPTLFLSLSLAGGALLAGQLTAALALLIAAAAVQLAWWLQGDGALERSGTDLATATGLGNIGSVRSFEPPHTGTNYLLKEFVYVVGRKHALKLRTIAGVAGYAAPALAIGAAVALGGSVPLIILAALLHVGGIAASRWLFFAEAEHVVGLYYPST
ncbi:MAG: DmsC/YnfH family molybdoenzyme membrane anchor subunit [Pseudomonadota bacterium]